MFSEAFVFQHGGGCLCMMSLPVWLPGPMFLLGVSVSGPIFLLARGVFVQGVCLGSLSGAISVLGVSVQTSLSRESLSGRSLSGGHCPGKPPGQRPPWCSKERVVLILLECILVHMKLLLIHLPTKTKIAVLERFQSHSTLFFFLNNKDSCRYHH